MGQLSEDTERGRGTSIFRNITKADLLHGMANRRSHLEEKQLKQANRELKTQVTTSVKLSDIVDLERFVKESILEKNSSDKENIK